MNVLSPTGAVLSGEELKSYSKRHGLCPICAETQTHKRAGKFFRKLRNRWQPLTVRNAAGDYTVYKGYCIQPTCYSLEQARRKLGEYTSRGPRGGSERCPSEGSCDRSLDSSFPGYSASTDPGARGFEYLNEDDDQGSLAFARSKSFRPQASPRSLPWGNRTPQDIGSPISTSSSLNSFGDGSSRSHGISSIPKSIARPPLVVGSRLAMNRRRPLNPGEPPPPPAQSKLNRGRPPPYSPRLSLTHRLDQFLSTDDKDRALNLSSIELTETNVATVLSVFQEELLSSSSHHQHHSGNIRSQPHLTTTTTLLADQCKLGNSITSLEKLLSGLPKKAFLSKISLRSNGIDGSSASAKCLATCVSSFRNLKDVNLARNKLQGKGATLLLDALCDSVRLQTLNLSSNEITLSDFNFHVWQNFFWRSRTIQCINLENNLLRDGGIQQLCYALSENQTLEKLFLSNNAFGNDGALALAGMLKTHCSMRILGIGQNSVEDLGAQSILDEIRQRRGENPSACTVKEISGLYTNRIANKEIIQDIERCLEEGIAKTFSDRVLEGGDRRSSTASASCSASQLDMSCTDITFDASAADAVGTKDDDHSISSHHSLQTDHIIVETKATTSLIDSDTASEDSFSTASKDCDASKGETKSTRPDDSCSMNSAETIDSASRRMLDSLLALPTLHGTTSIAAGVPRETCRGALEALDLASGDRSLRQLSSTPLYRREELKTVCLTGENTDDLGVEAIAFTLGSHRNSIEPYDSPAEVLTTDSDDEESFGSESASSFSDREDTSESDSSESGNTSGSSSDSEDTSESSSSNHEDMCAGGEAGIEVSLSAFQADRADRSAMPAVPSLVSEQPSTKGAQFQSRAELEAEISDSKKALRLYENSDDPAATRLRIKMRKQLIAYISQRRIMPSRQELEQKMEELDIELAIAETSAKRDELKQERVRVTCALDKEIHDEKRLKLDVSAHSRISRSPHSAAETNSSLPVPGPPAKAANTSNPIDRLTVFQSAPLSHVDLRSKERIYFPLLDFEYEARILRQALKDAERIGAKIELDFEVATTDRLSAFLAQGGRRVLHLSCHGHADYLALENGFGDMQPLPVQDLKRFLSAGDVQLDFVFISACHSKSAGLAFLNAGVRHVVCCRQDARFRDAGAVEFARHFYRALACDRTLGQAFNMAREAVRVSPIVKDSAMESDKFLLLPEKEVGDPYHDVSVFFTDETYTGGELQAPTNSSRILQRVPSPFLGREKDMYLILEAMRCTDLVQVKGPRGSGKSSVVAALCKYVQQRQVSFFFDDVLWLPAPQDFIETHDRLYSDFTKMFAMLNHHSISSRENAESYKECWRCILRNLQGRRCLLVIDGRRFLTSQGVRNLDHLLTDLLVISSVKVILIAANEKLNLRVSCRVHDIEALDFETSAWLFARLIQSSRYSAPQLSAILTNAVPAKQEPSKLNLKRKTTMFEKMGKGLPADIERAAAKMSDKDLVDLIRLAQRPVAQANTRSDLEESVRSALSEEAVALRKQHYLRARDLRDQIEELQSLRAQLPSVAEMEANIRKLKETLIKMVSARRYDAANKVQIRITSLEEQISKEKAADDNRNEDKFNKIREKARRLTKENDLRQRLPPP